MDQVTNVGVLFNELPKLMKPVHFLVDTVWIKPVLVLLHLEGMNFRCYLLRRYQLFGSQITKRLPLMEQVGGKDIEATLPAPSTVGVVFLLSAVRAVRIFDQVFIFTNAATSGPT